MNKDLRISQNFLVDPSLIGRIIDTRTCIMGEDIVIEIGAGKGAITFELAKRCKQVKAYELDETLFKDLHRQIARRKVGNIELINQDFLEESDFPTDFKVFSNIPFSLSSLIIRKLLVDGIYPRQCYFFLEKNTAYRYLGINGESILSLTIALRYDHSFVWQFDKYDFNPRPNADIVLVKFSRKQESLLEGEDLINFITFLNDIFNRKKHDLKGALLTFFTFKQLQRIRKDLDLDLKAVPSTLKIDKWVELFLLRKKLNSSFIP